MSRRRAPWIAVIAGLLCALPSLPSIAQNAGDPSVTIKVSPQTASQNGTVTLSGLAYAQVGTAVIVTVTPPAGAKVTQSATPDAKGVYSLAFTGTGVAGSYTVSAQLGARGVPAQAKFTVRNIVQASDDIAGDQKALIDTAASAIADYGEALDALPASPARTQAQAALAGVNAKMQALPQQSAYLRRALALFKDLQAQHPETATVMTPMYDRLDAWDDQARQRENQLKVELGNSRKDLARCDSIDDVIENLNLVSGALNFAAAPFDIVINFSKDLLASQASSALPGQLAGNAGASAATSEMVKMLPTVISGLEGPVGIITAVAGMVVDAATQIEKNAFAQYCQKFEGPFTATMTAHFYTNDTHAEWWAFSVSIAGRLTLRYPKEATGSAVLLNGEFLGRATSFGYREYVWSNSGVAKLAQGGVAKTIDVPPVAPPNVDYDGRAWSNASSPVSFDVPVSGQFANGRITFKLGDARSDFDMSYVTAHTVYVVMNPLTLGLPVWGHFTLPYKDAHFTLQHYVFDYPVVQAGNAMVVEKHDVQDRTSPGNKAHYALTLKICNPGCD